MKAFGVNQYDGGLSLLELPEPAAPGPDQVTVQMKAVSFNPVDTLIAEGYGAPAMNRRKRFPVVLGRDGCGVVTAIGAGVKKVKVGERVAIAVSPTTAGSFAERVVLPEHCVEPIADTLGDEDAAAISYVGSTAVQAFSAAGLTPQSAAHQVACINGASGGLGATAIQLLSAWDCHVIAVCSQANREWVKSLGADETVDYRDASSLARIRANFVLNAAPPAEMNLQSILRDPLADALIPGGDIAAYSTVITPVIGFITKLGVLPGMLLGGADFARRKLRFRLKHKAGYHWVIFRERAAALRPVLRLFESTAAHSVVQGVHSVDELPAQFAALKEKRTPGKTVFVW